jgi:response regulator RpfG family c-di-GMP phosphodiesterase
VLDRVAEVVSRQCEPITDDPPLSSRIIKVANAYDDLVGPSTDRDRAGAALERIRLAPGGAYDPHALEALARVIDRGRL